MDYAQINQILTIIFTLGSLLYYTVTKIARIELKVDTLWDFIIRRAVGETISKGLGSFNSPFEVHENICELVRPYVPQIEAKLGKDKLKKISNRDLFIYIEKNYGEMFFAKICAPYGFNKGACVLATMNLLNRNMESML